MRRNTVLINTSLGILALILYVCAANDIQILRLMPYPAEVQFQSGKFRLDNQFGIGVIGPTDDRLYKGATRALRRLSGRTGLFFTQDYISRKNKHGSVNFMIQINRPGELELFEDESYRLEISTDTIKLEAETDIGALRGLETFLQLLNADEYSYYFPVLQITDSPRFPWRGLMIDVSRHFMPVEVIKRNLRAMAAVKINAFHWHLSDDQGFRIECKTFPKLHKMGSDGFYYTQEQIKDVIAYASDLAIRVIPEFDIPAHTSSWFVGYPELASAPGPYCIERYWGVKDPVMDPSNENTYEFLDRFFAEMAVLFPDEYMHIGGDENNGKQWNANPKIQDFKEKNNLADNHELQNYFNRRVQKILSKHGKKMIGWDEILHNQLAAGVIIQSWRGHTSLYESARMGYHAILSRNYYIDLIQSIEFHYLNDPLPSEVPIDERRKEYILGGEVTSWGELVTHETIDSRIWPKTAAIAERLWSPQYVKDIDFMYSRLEIVSRQLEELGLQHITYYDMMLRRLSNYQDIAAVKVFVDVLEQVKNYDRHFQGITYSSFAPLTRTVDAAKSQSMSAHKFKRLVENFLNTDSRSSLLQIRKYLNLWNSNHTELMKIVRNSPILQEVLSLSESLKNVAQIGLEAIDMRIAKTEATRKWCLESMEILAQARKPRGQVELMIIDPIERLVTDICHNTFE
jgi:hexosaminidase